MQIEALTTQTDLQLVEWIWKNITKRWKKDWNQ